MHDTQAHPLISIIIPTKNRCSLLGETLESVRNQTYSHWEAVVVDDHSDDDTCATLGDLARRDPRVRYVLRSGDVGGADVARNQGYSVSNGSFVLFLDSDDLLAPTALEYRLRSILEFPEADAIVNDAEYFRCIPGEYHEECALSNRLLDRVDAIDSFLTGLSPWCTSGPLWRRASLERAGPWNSPHDNQYHMYALIIGLRFIRTGVIDWFIRHHNRPQVSRTFISGFSHKVGMLDEIIEMLQTNHMLTRRRKRLLSWRCLLETLTCAYERALPSLRSTLGLWSAAHQRNLFGTSTYVLGVLLTLLQRSKLMGPAPRELARLFVYCDLKKQSIFTNEFRVSLRVYFQYLAIHFRSWNLANGRKTEGQVT